MASKLPINLDNLLHHRTLESERIEYKAAWKPASVLHTLCAFANDFYNLGGGYVVVRVEGGIVYRIRTGIVGNVKIFKRLPGATG